MRVSVVKIRLRAARKLWAKGAISPDISAQQGFIYGVLRGLAEALKIVQQAQREDIQKIKAVRRPLSRWTALELYKACRQAYGRLLEGDRPTAMRLLRHAMERIRGET